MPKHGFNNSLRPRKPEGSLGRSPGRATSTLTQLLNYDTGVISKEAFYTGTIYTGTFYTGVRYTGAFYTEVKYTRAFYSVYDLHGVIHTEDCAGPALSSVRLAAVTSGTVTRLYIRDFNQTLHPGL